MNIAELQAAISAKPDGLWGPKTTDALYAAFTNRQARAATTDEMQAIADRLGCSLVQLAAVAAVETRGSGFDARGRPKVLFERHWFHRLTKGRFTADRPDISSPKPGGYAGGAAEFDRVVQAVRLDPDAGFSSASWGKFQVMGGHWQKLGYASPYAMAHSCVSGEASHLDMLARYIEANRLQDELRALSRDAETCRAFACAYNGPHYEVNAYHNKLAEALA